MAIATIHPNVASTANATIQGPRPGGSALTTEDAHEHVRQHDSEGDEHEHDAQPRPAGHVSSPLRHMRPIGRACPVAVAMVTTSVARTMGAASTATAATMMRRALMSQLAPLVRWLLAG